MKLTLKMEELGMLGGAIFLLIKLEAAWYFYLLLFIGPDISMLGYLAGNRAGAFCYNLFHHKGIAVWVMISGLITGNQLLLVSGIILFGHSSMDRLLGYGLKYETGFQFTHLGKIGKDTNG